MELTELKIDGSKLRLARERACKGKRAKEVAETLGVTKQTLCDIEAGRIVPSGNLLLRIVALYGVDLRNLASQDLPDKNFFRKMYGNA
ncbi:MAG TPA: helix-turn-helix transcriptional regulator [Blastocatellia bacterium]|nr:helix-turn-helix transcriptional regulator [Blastocatellia bacterium]